MVTWGHTTFEQVTNCWILQIATLLPSLQSSEIETPWFPKTTRWLPSTPRGRRAGDEGAKARHIERRRE